MGRAPPSRAGMPSGTHLVVHGPHDHAMLEITEIDQAGEGISARTGQVALLAQIAADPGMLRAEFYVDGHRRRMLGNAMIERVGNRRKDGSEWPGEGPVWPPSRPAGRPPPITAARKVIYGTELLSFTTG